MAETKIYTGTVKFFNTQWGYGMIIPDDKALTEFMEKKDIFVHAERLIEPISSNEKVEFEIFENENNLKAFNVKKIVNGAN